MDGKTLQALQQTLAEKLLYNHLYYLGVWYNYKDKIIHFNVYIAFNWNEEDANQLYAFWLLMERPKIHIDLEDMEKWSDYMISEFWSIMELYRPLYGFFVVWIYLPMNIKYVCISCTL